MNQKCYSIAGPAGALIIMLCGCSTPRITHNVAYDLSPQVARASAREKMKPQQTDAEVVFSCLGLKAESNDLAMVSNYHCEKPSQREMFQKAGGSDLLGLGSAAWIHILQTPEPIGKYVERAASAALASKGIAENPRSAKKLLLQLERFDYDETSDRKKSGPVIMPWQAMSYSGEGVLRKGFMDVVVKVIQADGTTAYQRRISVEVTRKRGQASSGVLFASVAIAQVSPIAPNPEAVREREEKTVTADVLADVFAKFQDELVADEDLLQAIRKQ